MQLSFEDGAISNNIKTLLRAVMVHKVPKGIVALPLSNRLYASQHFPSGAFIKSATLSSTKGPGYNIDFSQFLRELQPRTN
jgi:hypothetical protein